MNTSMRKILAVVIYLTYYFLCVFILAPAMFNDLLVLMLLAFDMYTFMMDTLLRPFTQQGERDWSTKAVGILFILHPPLLVIMFYELNLLTSVYFAFLDSVLVAFTGLIFYIIGAIIALASRIQLGRYGHGMIAIEENHELLTTGLYKTVRHPLYTGGLLGRIGIALTIRSYVTGFLYFLAYFMVFRARMTIEEELLLAEFGEEYEVYMQQTKRLIPRIY
jgi:protein-S-isoprenylcysteine O-methyltransferase Ste14